MQSTPEMTGRQINERLKKATEANLRAAADLAHLKRIVKPEKVARLKEKVNQLLGESF